MTLHPATRLPDRKDCLCLMGTVPLLASTQRGKPSIWFSDLVRGTRKIGGAK